MVLVADDAVALMRRGPLLFEIMFSFGRLVRLTPDLEAGFQQLSHREGVGDRKDVLAFAHTAPVPERHF